VSLLKAIGRSLLHAEKPRAEHVRDRIFEASGTYYFVPKGSDFGFLLKDGEAASIADRADANMQTAHKQTSLAVFAGIFLLMLFFPSVTKLGLPAAWSKMSGIVALIVSVAAGMVVHHVCLARFDRKLEDELSRHPRVSMDLLRDPKATSSFPKFIKYLGALIVLPLMGLSFYTMILPAEESNRMMAKLATLLHYIHLPLTILGAAMAVRVYRLRQKRGF
jgi:hypothetical protein